MTAATSLRKHPRLTDYAESVADKRQRENRKQIAEFFESLIGALLLYVVFYGAINLTEWIGRLA